MDRDIFIDDIKKLYNKERKHINDIKKDLNKYSVVNLLNKFKLFLGLSANFPRRPRKIPIGPDRPRELILCNYFNTLDLTMRKLDHSGEYDTNYSNDNMINELNKFFGEYGIKYNDPPMVRCEKLKKIDIINSSYDMEYFNRLYSLIKQTVPKNKY